MELKKVKLVRRLNGAFIVLRSTGNSYLSKQLVNDMGLDFGDKIDVLQDEDNPSDYYLKASLDGLELKCYRKKAKEMYEFHARGMARSFGRQFGIDHAKIKIKVGPKTIFRGVDVFPLITSGLSNNIKLFGR